MPGKARVDGAGSGEQRDIASLGAAVRAARLRQGLTVDQLTRRSGLSAGLISQLERGKGNPAFLTLHRLADSLGVPLVRLLQTRGDSDRMIVRAGERRLVPVPEDEGGDEPLIRELLTPDTHGPLQVLRTSLPPGFSNEGRPFRHLGLECVHVLSGSLLVAHGEHRVTLSKGDSMTYECSTPHWWANASKGRTVVIGAVTPFAL
jgi:transcriptional regulator with XRE-family HTH domain